MIGIGPFAALLRASFRLVKAPETDTLFSLPRCLTTDHRKKDFHRYDFRQIPALDARRSTSPVRIRDSRCSRTVVEKPEQPTIIPLLFVKNLCTTPVRAPRSVSSNKQSESNSSRVRAGTRRRSLARIDRFHPLEAYVSRQWGLTFRKMERESGYGCHDSDRTPGVVFKPLPGRRLVRSSCEKLEFAGWFQENRCRIGIDA